MWTIDPGFRIPIIKIDHRKEQQMTDSHGVPTSKEIIWNKSKDQRNIVPVQGYALKENSCVRSQNNIKISSWSQYQNDLGNDARVSIGLDAVVLSGSFLYSHGKEVFQKEVTDQKKEMFMQKSYCLLYVAGLGTMPENKLDAVDYFHAVAKNLPVISDAILPSSKEEIEFAIENSEKWTAFFGEFGTHFVSKVHIGGKMINTVITATTDRSIDNGYKTSSGVDASVVVANSQSKSGRNSAEDKDAATATEKASNSKKFVIIGGKLLCNLFYCIY